MTEPRITRIPRRTVLRAMGAAGGLMLSPLAAACGGAGDPADAPFGTEGKKIKKGGVLRIGVSGGSALSSLDPHVQPDYLSVYPAVMMFDQLAVMGADFRLTPMLAEQTTHNADGTEWTMTLRQGVTWHDGKPLTADDVAYSFARIGRTETGATSVGQLTMLKDVRAKGARTVVFTLNQPCGWFDIAVADSTSLAIVPAGFDPSKPIGTGPFKYKSWSAGASAEFVRNPDYWGQVAYLDSISISNIQDDRARFNALLSEQVDLAVGLTPAQLTQVKSNRGLVLYNSPSGASNPIVMRTDRGPLADPRLRKAIRLCLDREQINNAANGGYGQVGHDLYGIYDPAFDRALKRTQDVATATRLVQEAGMTGQALTLVTANIGTGVIATCQVVAANMAKIGLKAEVKVVDPATLYGSNYLSWDFTVDVYSATNILTTSATTDGPAATLNATHWQDAEYTDLWNKASAELDATKRAGHLTRMQQILFEKGGLIIPSFPNTTGAYKAGIGGLRNDVTGLGLARNLNLVGFTE